jgi:hypothetical protein
MIDHDWNADGVPITGKAGHISRFGLPARLCSAVAASCLFLLVLYPWCVGYYPEGNPLRGPLWLFRVQRIEDRVIGGITATILTPLIFTFLIKPGRLTAVLSIAAILAWVGLGMWLASMAAC